MPLFTSLAVLVALQPPTLPKQTFATSDEGWISVGDVAKASWIREPKSALQFEYTVDKRSVNQLVRPLEAGQLTGARHLHFLTKSDTQTTLGFIVQEKGGGRWMAIATVAKEAWQEIDLAPTDFSLGRDAGDPADANGKLDLESVEAVSIFDIHQFLVRADNPAVTALFPVTPGPRTLWLSAFSASAASLPPTTLDGLSRPQLSWMGIAGVVLKRVATGSPLPGPALEATYSVSASKLGGLFHPIPTGALAGKTGLSLSVAVQKSTSLVVQLEDDLGAKVNATIEVPGIRVAKKITLPFADFKPSDDSKRDKIDLSRIKQVLILDISGMTESVEQTNTLWLANLEAK